jgi:transposase
MAHARRKIHDEHVRRPTALKRIAALYAIEWYPGRRAVGRQKEPDGPADAVVTRLATGADEDAVGSC